MEWHTVQCSNCGSDVSIDENDRHSIIQKHKARMALAELRDVIEWCDPMELLLLEFMWRDTILEARAGRTDKELEEFYEMWHKI